MDKPMQALSDTKEKLEFPHPALVWCMSFAYASFLALTLQKLLLPLIPSLHADHGLLQNDAIYFHNTAVEIAERIRAIGWSEWKIFPAPGATANVAMLAGLYAFFGPDPAWFIPFNAAAHATGALMLYLIGPILWPGSIGRLGGLVAATLFLVFPSALQWYGQNHKDAFSIAGTLVILFVWIRVEHTARFTVQRRCLTDISLMFLGAVLITLVRPYLLSIVVLALFVSWVAAIFLSVLLRKLGEAWRGLSFSMLLLVIVASATVFAPKDREVLSDAASSTPSLSWMKTDLAWQKTDWIPQEVDSLFESASRIREHFIAYGQSVGAGSLIDPSRIHSNAASLFGYLPRALVVGLFSPFPESWTERASLTRIIGAVETLVWYLLFPGVLLFVVIRPNRAFFLGAIFCGVMLVALSYAHPVLGTLYRQRFGVLFFFILCGAVGWSRVTLGLLSEASSVCEKLPLGTEPNIKPNMYPSHGVTGVAASGAIVLAVSAASLLGFMVRDLLLVERFGIGQQLDVFFSAAMIPMFFVAFLSFPLADAMTAQFLRVGGADVREGRERLAQAMLSFATILLAVVGTLLAVEADEVIVLILGTIDPEQKAHAVGMLRWFTLVLVFSGWTVIGNSVLNLLQRSRAAALAQLPVPAITIIAILAFGHELGLYAAIYGMLFGLGVNIALVIYLARSEGLLLVPGRISSSPVFIAVLRNYAPLTLATLLAAAAIPINYAFAGMAGLGGVSGWALGSKIVQFVTGISSVVIGAVILPHLGGLIAAGRSIQLKSDIYFLLMSGTWISIVFVLAIYGFTEPLVVAVFEGGEVTREQADKLAAIVKLGSLQIPFVITTTLILKLTAVSGTSWRAVVATGTGLALNVALNLALVPRSGVLGIATATAIACGFSAGYLVIAMRKQCGLSLVEVAVLMGGWLALIGLSVSLHFHSLAAGVSSGLALFILAGVQFGVWQKHKSLSTSVGAARAITEEQKMPGGQS